MQKPSRFIPSKTHTNSEIEFLKQLENYYTNSIGTNVEKLSNFSKYVTRQDLTVFLVKYEIFKKILHIQGSVVECGVLFGGGLMTFAKLSAILEPINHQRKIIGFDTFAGFPKLTKNDHGSKSEFAHRKGYAVDSLNDLKDSVRLYDANRSLSHIPKVEIIKGNITNTIPKYLKENPHTVVSLLYLDVDIYEPTRVALEKFIPRMPKGSIIVFDELNCKDWTGETKAVLDTIGIRNLKIERFSFDTRISYAILD